MSIITLTPPAGEPVTLAELKSLLRIDASDTSNDDVINDLNIAAREWLESETRRRFITQQLALFLDCFPTSQAHRSLFTNGQQILLPFPPAQSVDVFKYVNEAGTLTTLDPSAYQADLKSQPARLSPLYQQFWPYTRVQLSAVEIHFTCGYGATGDTAPSQAKSAIRTLVANWYEKRTPGADDTIPKRVKDIAYKLKDARY